MFSRKDVGTGVEFPCEMAGAGVEKVGVGNNLVVEDEEGRTFVADGEGGGNLSGVDSWLLSVFSLGAFLFEGCGSLPSSSPGV